MRVDETQLGTVMIRTEVHAHSYARRCRDMQRYTHRDI